MIAIHYCPVSNGNKVIRPSLGRLLFDALELASLSTSVLPLFAPDSAFLGQIGGKPASFIVSGGGR
jgi:hypothetical protein